MGHVGTMAGMAGMTMTVPGAELAGLATTLRRAADEMARLRQHRGPVHGKAADGGDPTFAAAVDDFTDRWMWGIEVASRGVDLLADAVAKAAEVYAETERQAEQAFQPGGGERR